MFALGGAAALCIWFAIANRVRHASATDHLHAFGLLVNRGNREDVHADEARLQEVLGRLQLRRVMVHERHRRVRRRNYDGTWTVLCDSFGGKKLNAPNDAACTPDGSIYFTDPGYGIMVPYEGHKAEFELPTRVYRIAPDGKVTVAAEGPMRRPNGICFSPDFKRCYVVDTGATDGPGNPANIIVFDVKDQKLSNPKVFADFAPGFTDGIRCDTDGNVWCGWGWGGMETNGVRVHHPDGTLLAFLHTPEVIANLCFGGTKRNRLFMCGSTSIYALYVNAQGHALS